MHYELVSSTGEVEATLHFRSSFGSFATAESADGCWTFKRVGFWQTKVTVRPCGSDEDIARFKNNTWSCGGTLEFPDGRTFQANTNFWQTKFRFESPTGEKLIEFETSGLLHLSIAVAVQPGASTMVDLPLMVMLGCYLVVMMHVDQATTAVAAG